MLHKTRLDFFRRREALQLILRNAPHECRFSSTIATTKPISMSFEKTEIGVGEEQHAAVPKRKYRIDNFDFAIIRLDWCTKFSVIFFDKMLINGVSDFVRG